MKKFITMLVVSLGASLPCHADTALTLYDNATNYMQLKSPAAYTAPYRLKMPLSAGTTGQVMAVTGVAGSTGTLTFVDMSAYAGSIGVSSSGVVLSTAVKRVDFNGVAFNLTLAGTTIQVTPNVSSMTLQGNRYSLSGLAASTGTLTSGLFATGVTTGTLQAQIQAVGLTTATLSVSTASLQTQVSATGASTGTLQTQITAVGVSTGSLQSQATATAASTQTLAASLFATSTATGTLQTQLASVGTATATLATSLFATSSATGTLQTQITATGVTTGTLATGLFATGTATGTLATNFPVSLSSNVTGSLPATSVGAGTLGATVVASSLTAASVAPYAGTANTSWAGYRFPPIIYYSSTTVYADSNTSIAGQTTVLFPDGTTRAITSTVVGPGQTGRTWTANSTATFVSGSDSSGMLRNEYLTYNASGTYINWLYVKSQISTYTFVVVGDTTSIYSASTLNAIYGTNSWVYAGTTAWTKNNGTLNALVPFAYEGNFVNYMVNPGTLNGMATFTQGISLLPSTLNPSGGQLNWTYAAGQNPTSKQVPAQFITCVMMPSWTFATATAEVFVLYVQDNSGGAPGGACEGYYPGSPSGHAARLNCLTNITNGFTPIGVTSQTGDRIELDIGGCYDRALRGYNGGVY